MSILAFPRRTPAIAPANREFLPAALEVLETPPSPKTRVLNLTICLFVALGLLWSFLGEFDVNVVAPAKLETIGHDKVVEPLDAGRIAAVLVANGDHVELGQHIIRFDPSEAAADAAAADAALDAATAEATRRHAELDAIAAAAADIGAHPDAPYAPIAEPTVSFDPTITSEAKRRETAVLAADLLDLSNSLATLAKQAAEKRATLQRLEAAIQNDRTAVDIASNRVAMRQEAVKKEVGTKINLYDAQEALSHANSQLAADLGQKTETEAALVSVLSERAKTLGDFSAQCANKLNEAAVRADQARQTLAKTNAKLLRTTLDAPAAGTIENLSATTVGQVVTPGQQLATITPDSPKLAIEALIANMDVGFLKVGQTVAVKLDAFPYTRFGVLKGVVSHISTHAVDEQKARRHMSDATTPTTGADPENQNPTFVFPVTIDIDANAMRVDGHLIPLSPGMTATVDIKTDSRRIIDYVFSPLVKTASEAFHEQ